MRYIVFFVSSFGFVASTPNVMINQWTQCKETIHLMKRLTGRTLLQCAEECQGRPDCAGLNYRRKYHTCELLSSAAGVFSGHDRSGCVYLARNDISKVVSPCGVCNSGETCKTEISTCIADPQECQPLTLSNGIIQGNTNNLGSMVIFECSTGYIERNNLMEAECMTTGVWNGIPECARDCGIPSVPNSVISNGGTKEGSVRKVTCNQGYYLGSGDYGNVESNITCDASTGQWSSIACSQIVSTLSQSCSVDSDCLETDAMCISSECFCDPLSRYNSAKRDCEKVCTSLTTTFEEVIGAIAGYNEIRYQVPTSKAECESSCVTTPGCLSYEYNVVMGVCSQGRVTLNMILDAKPTLYYPTSITFVLSSRTCA